jgi:Zn-dependent M28 family amino/carboxypeptidase
VLSLVLMAGGNACQASEPVTGSGPVAPEAKAEAAPAGAAAAELPPAPRIDAQRAMDYLRDIVAIGRRSPGSPGHKKVQQYILGKLKGDNVEQDTFTVKHSAGTFALSNIIARYPGKKDGVIVIGGHYDTNHPLPDNFVGANDGGSSTALLLEFAHHLRGKTLEGYSVWLVWFDGEEAFREWSATDSLHGSRHLAARWEKDGTLKQIKALMVVDMIGDGDLNIEREAKSTEWLLELVYEAAKRLGYQSYFFRRNIEIDDDHVPFLKKGVPAADLIDLDYGYNNVFHHSVEDKLDKVSPKSLQIVGDVVLETVRLLNQRK